MDKLGVEGKEEPVTGRRGEGILPETMRANRHGSLRAGACWKEVKLDMAGRKKGHGTSSLVTSGREFGNRNRAAETQETQPCPRVLRLRESKQNLLTQFDNMRQKPVGL